MSRILSVVLLGATFLIAIRNASADEVVLLIHQVPDDGLVLARVDLTGAVGWCEIESVSPDGILAFAENGSPVPFQFIPSADFDPKHHVEGTVVMRLPAAADTRVKLRFSSSPSEGAKQPPFDGTVSTPHFIVKHDAAKLGGLPSEIVFPKTEKRLDTFRWNDRVYDRELGWFGLIHDDKAQVERVSVGPLCTVVRVAARYVTSDGKPPASEPEAVYDWHYFHDRPLVFVRGTMQQKKPHAWPEHHFLEFTYPQEAFPNWVGGDPVKEGTFTASKTSDRFGGWAAVTDGTNRVAMFNCGQVMLYDGGAGTYLHAHGAEAWSGWRSQRPEYTAWLSIGSDAEPSAAIPAVAKQLQHRARVAVTVPEVHTRIELARRKATQREGQGRRRAVLHVILAEQLEREGRLREAIEAAGGKLPSRYAPVESGDLGLVLETTDEGGRVRSLCDLSTSQELLAANTPPLFEVTLRHGQTKEEVRIQADAGWGSVAIVLPEYRGRQLCFANPKDARLEGLQVTASVRPGPKNSELRWTLDVQTHGTPWSVWRVRFPQVALANLGPAGSVFLPRASGEVQDDPWNRTFRFSGTYPSGWMSMPFLAAYAPGRTGLYVAMHDPHASTKDILVESRPAEEAVIMAFDHPAENMGTAGNGFTLPGAAVWRLLRGDWFDAAVVYRDFVRSEADWFPKLSAEGREDTPPWMRELSCWALSGGSPDDCVAKVKAFAEFLGVPVGFHWYNWHQIPFDNDYPHYFPTKEGFADAVKELQEANVYVMPYINGRLWDTRDRGLDDFEFTRVARPASTKDEHGEPYTESYSSKETDGSRVKLAAMCPTTEVWRNKVREIVLRLMNECGVKGVYIDQVAAARPRLCFDPSHGHPLGGGHWWTEAYGHLMERIHQDIPDDRMLTTECNAEPYAHRFDGYLTWHWQHDGQVAAFPAVYGGSIQMFGRAYRGGPTKDLALRMKAGQQLVFGEQIGWLSPSVIDEKENAQFLRQIVRLRHRFRRTFYAGQMARPPQLLGKIPKVTADWQWSGEWPVTTDAVLTGAWILPTRNATDTSPHAVRLLLLAVNVSDEPVTARLDWSAPDHQRLFRAAVRVDHHTAEGLVQSFDTTDPLTAPLTFPPRTAWAWEVPIEPLASPSSAKEPSVGRVTRR